jgi:hypothetical protein
LVDTATAHPCPLTVIAWRLGGLTLTELWWRHLGLGGTGSRAALADYLHGTSTWPPAAHNVLAQTLNEGLWDLRIPSLVPLREPGHVPRWPAPHTGHGQPGQP